MQSYYEQLTYFESLPAWAGFLCVALIYSWTLVAAGFVALRTGRSPYWAMLLFLPYFGFLLAWLLACTVWPRDTKSTQDAAETE